MSAIDISRAPTARHEGFGLKVRAFFSTWNEQRVTRNALNRLTERELADIGLTRADIERVVRFGC